VGADLAHQLLQAPDADGHVRKTGAVGAPVLSQVVARLRDQHVDDRLLRNALQAQVSQAPAPQVVVCAAQRARNRPSSSTQASFRNRPEASSPATCAVMAGVTPASQGVLAPLQFLAFAVSLALVLRYMLTGGLRGRDDLDRGQDRLSLSHHGHRRDLGEGRLRPVPLSRPPSSGKTCSASCVIALHTAYLGAVRRRADARWN
jgi:hypothetical protein